MMAPAIALLRNRWVLLIGGLVYMGLIWSIFLVVNHQEIVRAELLRSPTSVHKQDVMEMYESLGRQESWVEDDVMLMRLTEALVYQGRGAEARKISQGLLLKNPKDHSLRFQVALALHNAGLYEEAESHFSILLGERGDK